MPVVNNLPMKNIMKSPCSCVAIVLLLVIQSCTSSLSDEIGTDGANVEKAHRSHSVIYHQVEGLTSLYDTKSGEFYFVQYSSDITIPEAIQSIIAAALNLLAESWLP